MNDDEMLDPARSLNARSGPYAMLTVVGPSRRPPVGAQAIVLADGTLHGWIGGGCATASSVPPAQPSQRRAEARAHHQRAPPGTRRSSNAMSCASNGTIEVFIQPYGTRTACACSATRQRPRRRASSPGSSGSASPTRRPRHRSCSSPPKGRATKGGMEVRFGARAAALGMWSRAARPMRCAGRCGCAASTSGNSPGSRRPRGSMPAPGTPGEIALVAIVGVLRCCAGAASRQPR